jgi:predicted ester cyclase
MAKAKSKVKAKKKSKMAVKKRVTKVAAPAPAVRLAAAIVAVHEHSNKDIYRRVCDEVLNGSNAETATQLLDPVVVSHSPLPEQQPGAAGFIESLSAMRQAFPDLRAVATHLVAEGDHVAARLEVSATHSGDFFGIRATGRRIQYEEQVFVRFAGGRIVEHWAVADGLSILQQLGGEVPH